MKKPPSVEVTGFELHPQEIQYTRIACPKCRSKSFQLFEVWESSIEWNVSHGWFDRANGDLNPVGPIGLEASCVCGHRWKLRGVTQIDEVVVEEK